MKKLYKIPVYWRESKVVDVDAESIEEAIQQVEESDAFPCSLDGEYIEDSLQINHNIIDKLNEMTQVKITFRGETEWIEVKQYASVRDAIVDLGITKVKDLINRAARQDKIN